MKLFGTSIMDSKDKDLHPVLSGTLIVSPQSTFSSLKAISNKKSLQKHCSLFKKSKIGLERLEVRDKVDDKNPKIISLENCVKITGDPDSRFQISIVKKRNDKFTFFAPDEVQLRHWVDALQSIAFTDKLNTLPCNNLVLEKENDLYCTSHSDGIFTVNLLAADATKLKFFIENNLHTENKPIPTQYTLQLTATEIHLKYVDMNSVTLIAQWPYRYIRKYGIRDGKFTFEAGRKCDTGEGEFKFQHTNPLDVFECIEARMISMKKLINGANNIGSLDYGEHQLDAVLSMEAGSHLPLPPPPNQNYSESNLSQNSYLLHGFSSSTDEKILNNISMNNSYASSIAPPAIKSIPGTENYSKLRNDVPPKPSPKSTKCQNYELVSLAQTGTNDLSKPSSAIVLKSLPPPLLPTSPTPMNIQGDGNITKHLLPLPLVSDHATIKLPIINQPPPIPVRYKRMNHGDDGNYKSIENITSAWKTLGVGDVKHTENLTSTEDDFTNQKDFASNRKIPITVNAYCDAEESSSKRKNDDYDKLDFFAAKPPNPASDYQTIVTNTTPSYNEQTSQPVISNDYEIIGDCGTAATTTDASNNKPKIYRIYDIVTWGMALFGKQT